MNDQINNAEKNITFDKQGELKTIARLLNILGDKYYNLGDIQESLKYYQKALKMVQKLHLTAINVVYSETTEHSQDTLEHREAQVLYAGNHPDVALYLSDVSRAYYALGFLEKALDYREKSLTMQQALYKDPHIDVAYSLNVLGGIYHDLGYRKKSLQYYENSLEMARNLHKEGDTDIDLCIFLNNVGNIYSELGDTIKGLEYQEEALKIKQQSLPEGEDNAEVATIMSNIGYKYLKINIQKGLEYLEKSLKMRQALYKGNHSDVANSLKNMGIAYLYLANKEKSLEYFYNALTMQQSLHEDNYLTEAEYLNYVAIMHDSLGNKENSLKYKQQAQEKKFKHCLVQHAFFFGESDQCPEDSNSYKVCKDLLSKQLLEPIHYLSTKLNCLNKHRYKPMSEVKEICAEPIRNSIIPDFVRCILKHKDTIAKEELGKICQNKTPASNYLDPNLIQCFVEQGYAGKPNEEIIKICGELHSQQDSL